MSSLLHFHVRGELVGAPARTQEEVVGLGALPADPKQLEQVPELAMDVSTDLRATDLCQLLRRNASGRGQTDGDGRVDPLDVCLLDEDLARFETELLDLLFGYGLAAGAHTSASQCRVRGVRGEREATAPVLELLDLAASWGVLG